MLRVRDIMTTDVVTVVPEMSLRDAVELLATKHLSGAPVVSGERVIGVVSATDIMAFLAQLPGVPSARPAEEGIDDNVDVSAEEAETDGMWQSAYFSSMWDRDSSSAGR